MPGCLATRPDAVEPALQVVGAEARDHRDRPLPSSSLIASVAQDASARLEVVDAVERDALRLRRVGVPGDHGNARVDGLLMVGGQEVAVRAGDRDAVDALGDERFENFLLAELIGRFRRAPDDLDVAQFLRRALGADLRVVEDRDVQRLRESRRNRSLRGASAGGVPLLPPQATIVPASTATATAATLFIEPPAKTHGRLKAQGSGLRQNL